MEYVMPPLNDHATDLLLARTGVLSQQITHPSLSADSAACSALGDTSKMHQAFLKQIKLEST